MMLLSVQQYPAAPPRRLAAAVFAVAVLLGAADAGADILPTPRWRVVPNGAVRAAVEKDGVVYVGGSFTHVFQPPPADPLFVDRTTGAALTGCAAKTGSFNLVPDASGGAFVQVDVGARVPETFWDGNGPFAPPAGTTFLRVLPNCRWDRGFLPTLISPSGLPAVGGFFDTGTVVLGTNNGARSASLAVYDRVTGQRLASVTSWPVVSIGPVGMAGPDTVVVLTVENPPAVTYSLRHLTISTLTLSGQVPLPRQPAIVFAAARVFVRPTFIDDALGTPWPPNVPKPLFALDAATLQPSPGWTTPTDTGTPVVAGGFLFANEQSGLVRRNLATGAIDPAWQPRVGLAAASDGSRLIVASQAGYSALNPVTGAVEGWSVNAFGGPVRPLGQAISLGRVQGVNGQARASLAAVDAATGALLPFNPLAPLVQAFVTALAATSSDVYAAGELCDALPCNVAMQRSIYTVRRIDRQSGVSDPGWAPTFDTGGASPAPVIPDVLVATEGTLYLGGSFRRVGGRLGGTVLPMTDRAGVSAIDLGAQQITSWNPRVESAAGDNVRDMALAADSMYLGGAFTTVGGQPRGGFARVDLATGAPLTPVLPVALDVWRVATDGVSAYLLTRQTLTNPPLLARVDPAGGAVVVNLPLFTPGVPVYAGGRLYMDRERDALTLQPTSSPLIAEFAFEGEQGVMAVVSSGQACTFCLSYYGFAVAAPPAAPQGLAAQTNGNTIQLSWSPGSAVGGTGAPTSYVVRAGTAPGLANLADVDTGSLATSLAASAPNGTYFVRVHARNAYGLSPMSNEVSFTLGPQLCTTLPGAPGPLTATVNGLSLALAWGAATSATTYVLEAGSASGLSNLAVLNVGAGLTFGASAPAGTYFVRVRGSNACGAGPASNEVPITLGATVALPGTPLNLTAGVSSATVSIAWNAPASGGAPASYALEAGSAQGLADIAVVPVTGTGIVVPGVPAGRYFVRVRAVNAAGSGPPTTDVAVVVP